MRKDVHLMTEAGFGPRLERRIGPFLRSGQCRNVFYPRVADNKFFAHGGWFEMKVRGAAQAAAKFNTDSVPTCMGRSSARRCRLPAGRSVR